MTPEQRTPAAPPPRSFPRRVRNPIALAALTFLALAPIFFLSGCMTPEDKAFYGRGWINPSELDQQQPPPTSIEDPTAVEPHMMGPGYY